MNTQLLAVVAAAISVGLYWPPAQANDDANEDLHADHERRGTELRATRINRPVVLVDSRGQVMGRVVPAGQFGAVLLRFRQDTVVVPLDLYRANSPNLGTGLDWGSSYIVYGGLNCTGQVYLPITGIGAGGTRTVLPERRGNQWYLLIASTAAPISLPPEEARSTSFGGMNCFNSAYQGPLNVRTVQDAISLNPLGIAPFYYR